MNTSRLGQLDRDAGCRGRSVEQIGLLQQLHLTSRFLHKGSAFGIGCVEQAPFSILPVILVLERNLEDIEPVLLAGVLFDQDIRKQQAVRKYCHAARIEVGCLARPDL
jgi:hypothetical protein